MWVQFVEVLHLFNVHSFYLSSVTQFVSCKITLFDDICIMTHTQKQWWSHVSWFLYFFGNIVYSKKRVFKQQNQYVKNLLRAFKVVPQDVTVGFEFPKRADWIYHFFHLTLNAYIYSWKQLWLYFTAYIHTSIYLPDYPVCAAEVLCHRLHLMCFHPRVFARSHWHHCNTDKLSFHASMQQSWHYCKLGVTVSVLY